MGFQFWIEEHDKGVWHLATQRLNPRSYRVACGSRMTRADARIYPHKPWELGPSEAQRCRACVGGEQVAIPIDVPASVSKAE